MPVCDGCGARVDEQHIRQRIERLELATRFRPIHIGVLLIDAAPPAVPADFFYSFHDGTRTPAGQAYFDDLMTLLGAAPGAPAAAAGQTEVALAEFQRRGFFLTSAIECPVTDGGDPNFIVRGLAPIVLRRVRSSYKPKHIGLISEPTRELIEPFRGAGWGARLILEGGRPFAGASMGSRLAAAVAGAA